MFLFRIFFLTISIQLQIPFDKLIAASTGKAIHNDNTTVLQSPLNTVNLGCLLTTLKNGAFRHHNLPGLKRCYVQIQEQTFHDTLELLVQGNPHASRSFTIAAVYQDDGDRIKQTEIISGNLQLTVEKTCLTQFLYDVLEASKVNLT